jgi:hypothetical protein
MSAALHPQRNSAPGAELTGEVQACTSGDRAAQMAIEAGVSRRMIFLALKVRRLGCEEIHTMLRDGPLSMSLAAVLVDLFPNHDDQRTVIAEFPTLPVREWLGFARRVHELTERGA